MENEGIPLIRKWQSTGKIDLSDTVEIPASGGRARVPLSSGFILQTCCWDLLEELKPKVNKIISVTEL